MTPRQRAMWIVLLVATAISCIHPPFPKQMLLQHFPTVALLIALPLIVRRYPLSDLTFGCIIAFMLFHIVGARYIYSYVPYDEWTQRLFGFSLTQRFHLRRNHYDRVVHFAFGLLAGTPVREIEQRYFGVQPRIARFLAIEFVLAFSMLYELFEWGLTMVLSPDDAGAYNGEQGDIWDAHKDMLSAAIGAIVWYLGSRVRVSR